MPTSASERLHAIALRLRTEGQRGLQREMNAAFRASTRPLIASVRAAARERLPKAGGLNEQQASQAIRVSVLTGSRSAGVRIRTRTRGSMQTDKGYVRHPVFGTWRPGVSSQQIPGAAGWWTDTLRQLSPAITPAILAEMNRVARIIQDGYR